MLAKKRKVVLIMGDSGSGKSTLETNLTSMGFNKVISNTTRPIDEIVRKEKDGVDYHFITDEEYSDRSKKGEFVQETNYGGYRYSSSLSEYTRADISTLVVVPKSAEELKRKLEELGGFEVICVFLDISRNKITQHLLNDGETIEGAEKRFLRGSISDEIKETNLDVDLIIKDEDLNDFLAQKVYDYVINK